MRPVAWWRCVYWWCVTWGSVNGVLVGMNVARGNWLAVAVGVVFTLLHFKLLCYISAKLAVERVRQLERDERERQWEEFTKRWEIK